MQMNRQWMYGNRLSSEFITGLQGFLRVADAYKRNGFVVCPCSVCKNQNDYSTSRTLHIHLLQHGFMPSYNFWTKHGERVVIMEEMKKKRTMETILSSLNTMMLSWGKLKGKLKKRHMMSPLMNLVGPLLMHRETAKLKRRRRTRMLKDHKKALYPNCEDGLKKLGSTLELLKWKAEIGCPDSGFEKL